MAEDPRVAAANNPGYAQRGTPKRYDMGGEDDDGGKKSPGAPADFTGAAREMGDIQQRLLNEQTLANRPNQNTPFASSQWTRGPDGQWQQSVSLNGGLGQASDALQGQLAQQLGVPLDFSGLPELGTGESARQQASDAAYQQATSRLDPQFREMEERNRTRLLNQGLSEGSEAYSKAMDRLSQQRADAYNQANFSAIREGTAAGSALFNQNLAARNQGMQERLRQRGQPLAELQALQGFTAMPGYSQAGQGQAPNLLAALGMEDAAHYRKWLAEQQSRSDTIGAGFDLLGTLASVGGAFLSDERAKTNVERLPEQVAPGVPLAVFRYRPEHGPDGLYAGVVAQDVQREYPRAVTVGPGGMLFVSGHFAPTRIGD
jgi:hypothetical protein